MPLVTIIIPVYNGAEFLGEALDSCRSQTCSDFEVIVVDDRSPSDAVHQAQRIETDPRVKFIFLSRNQGDSARNAGIRAAQGNFIAFLDVDDLWQPDYLRLQVENLRYHSQALASVSDVIEHLPGGQVLYIVSAPSMKYSDLICHLLFQNFIHTLSAVVVRREAFHLTGYLDASLRVCADAAFYLRLYARTPYLQLKGGHVMRRLHDLNVTRNFLAMHRARLKMISDVLADDMFAVYRPLRSELYSHWNWVTAETCIYYREHYLAALRCIAAGAWHSPIYSMGYLRKKVRNITQKIKQNLR